MQPIPKKRKKTFPTNYKGITPVSIISKITLILYQTYEEIRKEMTKDKIMRKLFKFIQDEWPTTKAEIPLCVRHY